MQGKKVYQEKLFSNFQLSQRIPKTNFYRRLKEVLNLSYLYKKTEVYYCSCGQKSIDPVVFFKLCLVGYLENIISDRKLIEHCSMRLDILFFLGFDIDEELPWHSTLSRTRQLFPDSLFESVFEQVLIMCIEKGMVAGHTQAIDSAPVKANASMDSLELKVPEEKLEEYIRKARYLSSPDRKAKHNKASDKQQTVTASKRELKALESRTKNWQKTQDQRPGAQNKGAKYTSNKTHYSPSDPDARISVKPGKARKLNYLSQLSVDSAHHVITHIQADFAYKKDSQCLQNITRQLKRKLWQQGLHWQNLLADTGYSSGENYAFLERQGITAYIPPHGTYKGGPANFTYIKDGDYWLCRNNKKVTFRKITVEHGKNNNKKRLYLTRASDCKGCTYKSQCAGKAPEKRIAVTIYKEEYERVIARIKSKPGRYMKSKRQSTVEPVFGTLTEFLGMRKVNTRGIAAANKCMLMSAVAYNLKKYLKYEQKRIKSMAQTVYSVLFMLKHQTRLQITPF